MKLLNLLFTLTSLFFLADTAHALTHALKSNSGAEVLVDSGSELGKNIYLIKLTGVKSPWANKVIKTTLTKHAERERYGFEYEYELSSGIQKKQYQILVESGKTLINGSLVRKFELHFQQDGADKVVELYESPELATKEAKTDLQSLYKKSPFKPEVE